MTANLLYKDQIHAFHNHCRIHCITPIIVHSTATRFHFKGDDISIYIYIYIYTYMYAYHQLLNVYLYISYKSRLLINASSTPPYLEFVSSSELFQIPLRLH